jgi:hypothetical protein
LFELKQALVYLIPKLSNGPRWNIKITKKKDENFCQTLTSNYSKITLAEEKVLAGGYWMFSVLATVSYGLHDWLTFFVGYEK